MAERLKTYEVENLARSMAMAPVGPDQVARSIQSHQHLSRDWKEVEDLLVRPAPAWAEVRTILNELNRVLG